ncbi:hypothetical protein TNCV_3242451 [Trichonephila clavipes]|nr:hypothetical protein TNCV_3242451 [Trichonephila clavipes]
MILATSTSSIGDSSCNFEELNEVRVMLKEKYLAVRNTLLEYFETPVPFKTHQSRSLPINISLGESFAKSGFSNYNVI